MIAAVFVGLGVDVAVGLDVGVAGTSVDGGTVFVGFGLRVFVTAGVHGMKTSVLVGLAARVAALVADDKVVGAGEDVDVVGGNGVPVTTVMPGVRKSSQPGCVRIEASTGSMNPLGLLATNVLFGSM
jgi:hypothetical protein